MVALSEDERALRIEHMASFGAWLKRSSKTQKWAATKLEIYSGYLSNLITGKNVASAATCSAAGDLMVDELYEPPAGAAGSLDLLGEFESNESTEVLDVVESAVIASEAQQKLRTNYSLAHRRGRHATPVEIEATRDVVIAMIESDPGMTPERLVAVTRALIEGLSSPL